MCGRYTLSKSPEDVRKGIPFVGDGRLIQQRFNIAPSQSAPVVAAGRELRTMRWGLVPFWAKDESLGYRMINARSETAHEKPAFKKLLTSRRCLVLADGFYEWKKIGARGKQPYYFRLKSEESFAFAGLWDEWRPDAGTPLQTFTILTTEANECVRPVHPRMPVILPAEQIWTWLEAAEQDPLRLTDLLRPISSGLMCSHPVRPLVNSPRNDSPLCVEPVLGEGESGQTQPNLL